MTIYRTAAPREPGPSFRERVRARAKLIWSASKKWLDKYYPIFIIGGLFAALIGALYGGCRHDQRAYEDAHKAGQKICASDHYQKYEKVADGLHRAICISADGKERYVYLEHD